MINMIVAVSKNGVIGKNGTLPWRISEDLKNFKALTMNGILFVGKKTAEALPPLPGREIIVLNRDLYPRLQDLNTFAAASNKQVWVIGGAAIYNTALELDIVDKVYLTFIDKEYEGDTFFQFKQFKEPYWILTQENILRKADPCVSMEEWTRRR